MLILEILEVVPVYWVLQTENFVPIGCAAEAMGQIC